ncbi:MULTISPECIES: hypothetical protein [Rhodococcus]|uniref:hypothetical protein n=1 Tax=Rhodococcus TaxID=1827 RepID=UPI00110F40BC|nr:MULTISPECIES: hypothetical protein [Rhodococcus]MBX4171203.1 hypothetical protein [Rhodococcus sp. DMU2021]MDJ0401449.1 hypothetical protein [Rhodococcus rhodochrous]QXF84017.1 hypothetical protein HBA53_23135 [Rhodococcus pyridinivorans]
MTAAEVATRVDRLFQLAHEFGQSERSAQSVAAAVSADLGTEITADDIIALRSGTHPGAGDDLLAAIAREFSAPENYLIDLPGTANYDLQFRALIAARDAKLNGICFRGGDGAQSSLESLVTELEALVDERRRGSVTSDGTPV